MTLLIGIDEAGYGPRLGPLVMTATGFRCARGALDLWETLSEAVTDALDRSGRLCVADSKKVFNRSARGLGRLEQATLAFLAAAGERPGSAAELLQSLHISLAHDGDACPWYRAFDVPVPSSPCSETARRCADGLACALGRQSVSFLGFRSQLFRVKKFNDIVARTQNKATLLFEACTGLMQDVLADFGDTDVVIHVDRLGGRRYYREGLAEAFPAAGIETVCETPNCSRYAIKTLDRTVEISFTVKADQTSFPVALAGMVSKYVRELHMRALNAWWTRRVSGLVPTAGYAAHAAEFIRLVEPAIRDDEIDRLAVVRLR